jgi:hypothetical protein
MQEKAGTIWTPSAVRTLVTRGDSASKSPMTATSQATQAQQQKKEDRTSREASKSRNDCKTAAVEAGKDRKDGDNIDFFLRNNIGKIMVDNKGSLYARGGGSKQHSELVQEQRRQQ